MNVDTQVVVVIMAMAFITAATRVGGYWLSGRFTITGRTEVALNLIPGTILTALVAPAIVAEGVTGAASAAVSVLVMRRNGNLIVTLVVGLGVFVLLRNIG
jgi:uncharacterized membrane protein